MNNEHIVLLSQLTKHGTVKDHMGGPLMTATDDTNPWWGVLEKAIVSAGGALSKPEFFLLKLMHIT